MGPPPPAPAPRSEGPAPAPDWLTAAYYFDIVTFCQDRLLDFGRADTGGSGSGSGSGSGRGGPRAHAPAAFGASTGSHRARASVSRVAEMGLVMKSFMPAPRSAA